MENAMEQSSLVESVTIGQGQESSDVEKQYYNCEIFDLYLRGIFNSVVIILGWIFNICTVITLWDEKKKNGTSFLLICLAVADSLVLLSGSLFVTIPSLCLYRGNHCQGFYYYLGYVYNYNSAVLKTTNLFAAWIMVLVTVQRFILVTKPHSAKTLTSPKAVSRWVALVILLSAIYSIPFFFKYETFFDKQKNFYYFKRREWSKHVAYRLFYDLLCYSVVLAILPLAVLTYTTFHLIKSLKEAKKKKKNLSSQGQERKSKEDITLSLVIVVIIYAVCQVPNPSRHIWTLFDPDNYCGSPYYAFFFVSCTTIHINSAFNFLVFFLIGKRFRDKFLAKIQWLFRRKKNQIAPAGIETVTGTVSTMQPN